jgi:hypothetical protein
MDVNMKNAVIALSIIFVSLLPLASAEVWIPEDEFHGYFDSSGIYTVVGAVRNTEDFSVLPTIEIKINENGNQVSVIQQLPTVFPHRDIPFKLKFSEIKSQNIVLGKPSVSFEKINKPTSNVQIIYDKTLVKHDDGHLTGRIINQGNATEFDLKVYATIHGKNNKFLDVGKNAEKIDKIEPGQILEFAIYPDPLFAPEVNYYSCFAIGDETIVPLYTNRNGEKFNFRYDSTAAFIVVGFDESGTTLFIDGINSFKVPTYVNFEFPRTSDSEKFDVLVNDRQTEFIQSKDEEGNWHVAFGVDGASQSKIVISGFEKPQPTSLPILESKTAEKTDYALVYYVVIAVVVVMVGIFLYRYQARKKLTT